jgi:hypothetical protein
MVKTTLYLPERLKIAVTRASASRGISEAEFMRTAIAHEAFVGEEEKEPEPFPVFYSGGVFNGKTDEELLEGFGE